MGQVYLKAILKKQEKPKSKLGLPRAAKGHNKGLNNLSTKISEVTQKKVSGMSSHGPPSNYCGALKTNFKDMC